jgi:hypothetical protein
MNSCAQKAIPHQVITEGDHPEGPADSKGASPGPTDHLYNTGYVRLTKDGDSFGGNPGDIAPDPGSYVYQLIGGTFSPSWATKELHWAQLRCRPVGQVSGAGA